MTVLTLDTNVVVAGLRSRSGASHWILQQVGTGLFDIVITQDVYHEYEGTLRRPDILDSLPLSDAEVCKFLS
ncbi:MAG: PIN domain-containing protein [Armatimonadetes bacterium]|nr:PIN domain-containing protein [Armatimonadota bacterium]